MAATHSEQVQLPAWTKSRSCGSSWKESVPALVTGDASQVTGDLVTGQRRNIGSTQINYISIRMPCHVGIASQIWHMHFLCCSQSPPMVFLCFSWHLSFAKPCGSSMYHPHIIYASSMSHLSNIYVSSSCATHISSRYIIYASSVHASILHCHCIFYASSICHVCTICASCIQL